MSESSAPNGTPAAGFIVGGMTGVGKTTLLKVMQGHKLTSSEYEPTCICDIAVTVQRQDTEQENYFVFYDMAGSRKFQTGRAAVYCHSLHSVHGAILVFDISDRKSFEELDHWHKELNVVFPLHSSDFLKILVGNKLDKQTLSVPMLEIENWAEKHDFRICLTAARDGRGVPEICPFLAEIIENVQTRLYNGPGKSHSVTTEQVLSIYRIIYGENDWDRLELPAGSSGTLIAKAYRRIAAQIHPDKCPVNGSEEAFKLLTASKDAIVSPGVKGYLAK